MISMYIVFVPVNFSVNLTFVMQSSGYLNKKKIVCVCVCVCVFIFMLRCKSLSLLTICLSLFHFLTFSTLASHSLRPQDYDA